MMDEQKLINDHWSYIECILYVHDVEAVDIAIAESYYKSGFQDGLISLVGEKVKKDRGLPGIAGFHYRAAFDHGLKHFFEEN